MGRNANEGTPITEISEVCSVPMKRLKKSFIHRFGLFLGMQEKGPSLPSDTNTHPLASLPSKHFRLNSHFLSYLIEASTIKSRLE
ncbi:hypothetical protein CK203_114917 [Vitis vinifera]|uniref:Uncharacterized protein n=1 Tax=Vitis vinifera TaxID=29760 RepID=A0A438C4T4_VITVI|nr:hypothetical protein CK203_114917 [Vitis vinifera]